MNTVELLKCVGSDEDIASAAWTSSTIELTPERQERVPALVHQLYREGHHSPFEHNYLKFKLIVDNSTHIQMLKHRIGVSFNVESARYRAYREDKTYIPNDANPELQELLKRTALEAWENYHYIVDNHETMGLTKARAKEIAKFVLPMSSQVEMVISFNLRSFFHFLGLRDSPHAQKEIREVAQEMKRLVIETNQFRHAIEAFDLFTGVENE
jgi:thymidylate synthase (FAD)